MATKNFHFKTENIGPYSTGILYSRGTGTVLNIFFNSYNENF